MKPLACRGGYYPPATHDNSVGDAVLGVPFMASIGRHFLLSEYIICVVIISVVYVVIFHVRKMFSKAYYGAD